MTTNITHGTAKDALAQPAFRRIFFASFLSNAGRWMQSAAQGVLAWELTGSSAFLGLLIFAQLGPLGILSLVGGSLADSSDRRRILLGTQTWQMFWSAVLAVLVIDDHIAPPLFVAIVFVTGLGQGLFAPAFTSVLPALAGPGNLAAAVSLNSTQTNAARVIGPAFGGWLTSIVGFAEVFAINSFTYVAVIFALYVTELPSPTASASNLSDRLFGGFRVASRAPQVGRPLLAMMLFALLCLPFIGQLPAIAELNLGIDPKSGSYGYFYASFGFGALIGALLVGTALVNRPRETVARVTLFGFAGSLLWLSTIDNITIGYFAIFVVGLFYFVLPTTLNTMWQEHVDETVRGRVAAVWVLSFGGTVPFSNVIAGQIVELTSLRTVLLGGVVAAVALSFSVRFVPGPVVGEELLTGS